LYTIFSSSAGYKLNQGVEATLKYFHDKVVMGIISNGDERARDILKSFNLLHYFDFILVSRETGTEKPNREMFEMALAIAQKKSKVEIIAKDALHVGDDYKLDVIGATNSGWNGVLVDPEGKIEPTRGNVIKTVDELIQLCTVES
jgi:FMN phosphatase YigB (HAD superfamily)